MVETDHNFTWELYRTTMRCYIEPLFGWDDLKQRQEWEQRTRPTERMIVNLSEKPVGHLERIHTPNKVIIGNLQLHPEAQGKGLGTVIMTDECERARSKGKGVRLGVLVSNPRAKALYGNLGFHVVEETENIIFLENSIS